MVSVTRDTVQTEIFDLVRKYSLSKQLELTDASEVETLGVDSIDLMEIVFRLEEKFGAAIDDSGLENLPKLGDLVDLAHRAIPSK
jgi:acyl carrier protein